MYQDRHGEEDHRVHPVDISRLVTQHMSKWMPCLLEISVTKLWGGSYGRERPLFIKPLSWFYLHSFSRSFQVLTFSHPRVCRHQDLHSQEVCPAPLWATQDKGSQCCDTGLRPWDPSGLETAQYVWDRSCISLRRRYLLWNCPVHQDFASSGFINLKQGCCSLSVLLCLFGMFFCFCGGVLEGHSSITAVMA